MGWVLLFVLFLCQACWLGAMVFFALIVAPTVFSRLPLPEAGKVISGIFPRYYVLGYCAGTIALIVAIYLLITQTGRLWWAAVAVAFAAGLGITVYSGVVLRPQIDALRAVVEQPNPDPTGKARFDKLHRLSVQLNATVMALNLVALASTARALIRNG